ncbi:MAG: DUF6807 family protein [Pirellulaceae bacterium]|nr:DUF6807 family protein [Pirellulaceae bacterium]
MKRATIGWGGLGLLLAAYCGSAAEPKSPVMIDTDIGSYVDDAFALGLALASPELELVGVTTCGGQGDDRAWLVCRFITQCERAGIPVAAGAAPQAGSPLDWQIQYRRHPAAIFNRTLKPISKSAVELLRDQLAARKGELTIIALGPLTNIARLLKEHPETKPWIKRIVLLGGSLKPAADGLPEPEFNLKADIPAARAVFAAGIPLVVVPADAAEKAKFTREHQGKLFTAYRPLALQLHNLFELHGDDAPLLFDPVAVAAACGQPLGQWSDQLLAVDETGRTLPKAGSPNCRVLSELKSGDFLAWMTDRLAADGPQTLPRPQGNRSQLIARGNFPARVHVFEDYDTDIERRWWMSGKEETNDVPPGSRRACRAVLTEDFDDRQGDTQTMYRAVIFNPVPGPPMGPNTRLSFRYKLLGTSELRVQLYSLTNGYHRYLSLAGLPEGKWSEGTVDMTAMRRPDGTGGPLAADERIDDIQFYVDPRAGVLIDDVLLYDAAEAGDKDAKLRPFPRRVLFTGWFDTGKQGKEWPGEFEILSHDEPRTWKFAQSVPGPEGRPWLRVHLRGPRRLNEVLELTFQHRLTGTEAVRIELFRDGKPLGISADLAGLQQGVWTAAGCRLEVPAALRDEAADEIRFLVPGGGKLAIDDLLLFVPAEEEAPAAADAAAFQVREEDGGITILDGGAKVLHYQREPKSLQGKLARANYVHPLYDLDGNVLTEDFPEDHKHHRGIFWGWHQLWVGDQRVGDSWALTDFRCDISEARSTTSTNQTEVAITALWKSPRWRAGDGQPRPFVREQTWITTHAARADHRAIDFGIRLLALVPDVKLGGSEDEKGYGGFSPRLRLPAEGRFLGEKGELTPAAGPLAAGPWVDFSARFGGDGKPSGVALLAHPSLPVYPPPWILRCERSMQNAVFPGAKPVPLSTTEPLVLRYRIVVHRGVATREQVAGWQREYAATAPH